MYSGNRLTDYIPYGFTLILSDYGTTIDTKKYAIITTIPSYSSINQLRKITQKNVCTYERMIAIFIPPRQR